MSEKARKSLTYNIILLKIVEKSILSDQPIMAIAPTAPPLDLPLISASIVKRLAIGSVSYVVYDSICMELTTSQRRNLLPISMTLCSDLC